MVLSDQLSASIQRPEADLLGLVQVSLREEEIGEVVVDAEVTRSSPSPPAARAFR